MSVHVILRYLFLPLVQLKTPPALISVYFSGGGDPEVYIFGEISRRTPSLGNLFTGEPGRFGR